MSPTPTLFNNGARTNNLLISTQLPSGTQQLTLASPSADMKDNIATYCYDNLYQNTTTTTMFNLQQTTSVMNQQTTSTQQMSTTSILVNDKISGNATFSVEPQENCNDGSNYNKIDLNNCNDESSVTFSNSQMGSGNFDTNYASNEEVSNGNENSSGNEESQTSAGTQEEEDETEEEVATKNDAGNQTDMPEEAKLDSDDNCSQDASVQNDISDKPMSLNHGEENSNSLNENKEMSEKGSNEEENVTNVPENSVTLETPVNTDSNQTQILFNIDTRQVSITPIVNKTNDSPELQKGSTCDNLAKTLSNETLANVSIVRSITNSMVDISGPASESIVLDPSSNNKDNISPESKKKIKQMPSLYPIHQFLPNAKTERSTDTRLVGFRSMPLLEDATKSSNLQRETNDEVCDRELVVNALIGLGNNARGLEESKREPMIEQNKTSCDKQGSSTPRNNYDWKKTDDKGHQAEVKPSPRVFSVRNLLDKNFSCKNKHSIKPIEQNIVSTPENSNEQFAQESLGNMKTEQTKVEQEHLTNCDNEIGDDILEVASILCSALFTSERSSKWSCENAEKSSNSVQREESRRKDSESSGESGVDLSGLELLSRSIDQLEQAKDKYSGDLEHKEHHKDKFCDPEYDIHSDTSHNDSGISRGLDFLCTLAKERILQEESTPTVATSPQAWALSKHNPLFTSRYSASPSRWMMSSDTEDEMFIQPYKPRLYKRPPGMYIYYVLI